jgi:hypothetical protein
MQDFIKILEGISAELEAIQGSPTRDAIYKLKTKVDGLIVELKDVPDKPETKIPEEPEAAPASELREPEAEAKPEE